MRLEHRSTCHGRAVGLSSWSAAGFHDLCKSLQHLGRANRTHDSLENRSVSVVREALLQLDRMLLELSWASQMSPCSPYLLQSLPELSMLCFLRLCEEL